MSRDKLIGIGVVVLGLLGFLVYRQAKHDEALGAPAVRSEPLPTISAPDDVDKLSITNGEKPEIVLEKVADTKPAEGDGGPSTHWVMIKPAKAEANQQTIKDMVNNLKDLTVSSQVDLKLDDEVKKEKQLDPAHAVHLMAWKGADKKIDESFGKSGPAGQLVMLTSQPSAVYAAKGYSAYLYTKEPKDLRDKEIFHLDEQGVSEVEIANTHGTFAFAKGDSGWTGTFDKKSIPRFDPEKVKDMVRIYKSVNASDFGDGTKSDEEMGLDKPDARVTLHVRGDDKAYEVSIGHVSSGTDRWAKRADKDQIYQMTNYATEFATSDVSKFEASADAGAGDGGAKGPKARGDAGKK